MQVESDFTHNNTPQVSIGLRHFIFVLAEDIVRYSESFEKRKKRLKARCELEKVDYNTLEYNLNLFFELIEDYRKSNNPVMYRFLKLQAGFCFIDETDFVELLTPIAGQIINNYNSSGVYKNKTSDSTSSYLQGGIVGGHLFGLY
jgi:hypothetical protein